MFVQKIPSSNPKAEEVYKNSFSNYSDSSPAKLSLSKESPPVAIRRLKYEMCKNWREKGTCKYGDRCLFAHGDNELTKTSNQASSDSAKSEISST